LLLSTKSLFQYASLISSYQNGFQQYFPDNGDSKIHGMAVANLDVVNGELGVFWKSPTQKEARVWKTNDWSAQADGKRRVVKPSPAPPGQGRF
jgi:hypothetical protein